MKAFFERYSYNTVKMFVNQIALALFGLAVATGAGATQNVALRTWSSVFAVVFYLCLLYCVAWEIGAKDRISVDSKTIKKNLWTGVIVSLIANSINILLALLFLIAQIPGLNLLGAAVAPIMLLIEGMYTGLLALHVGGAPLNSYWWTYFLIILPALVTSGIGYFLGFKEFRIFNFKHKKK